MPVGCIWEIWNVSPLLWLMITSEQWNVIKCTHAPEIQKCMWTMKCMPIVENNIVTHMPATKHNTFMQAYKYTYTNMHTYTHRHTHNYTHTYTHKQTYRHRCIAYKAHTYIHPHTHMHTHMHRHTHLQMHSPKKLIYMSLWYMMDRW